MKVVITATAKNKLRRMYDYVRTHQDNAPNAYAAIDNAVLNAVDLLTYNPLCGRGLRLGKRFITVNGYVFVYKIFNETLFILMLYGAGENWTVKE